MKNNKILLVLPFGMCIRQILFNKVLWKYFINTYKVDILTPIKIVDSNLIGLRNVSLLDSDSKLTKLYKIISYKSVFLWRLSGMVDFFLENDLGENLSLRWRWFNNYCKKMFFYAALKNYPFIYKLFIRIVRKLSTIYPNKIFKNQAYEFVVLTHMTDLECTLIGLGANKNGIPVITVTLGLDNYRHGPLLYVPDLMLLWGDEQVYEFNNYHLSHNEELKRTEYETIGSLIHDLYLERIDKIPQSSVNKKYSIDENESFILVPAMIEEMLPSQKSLCEIIIDFIKLHNLNIKIVVRMIPKTDQDMWHSFRDENFDYIILQEPSSTIYDKREGLRTLDYKQSYSDIDEFVYTIKNALLIINLYPTTLILDAMLLGTDSVVAMFDWTTKGDMGRHPQEKFYLAKKITHQHSKHYNLLYSREELYDFMYSYLVKGEKGSHENSMELFNNVCGKSLTGQSGYLASKAIDSFMNSR
jgi:hypothetical protein